VSRGAWIPLAFFLVTGIVCLVLGVLILPFLSLSEGQGVGTEIVDPRPGRVLVEVTDEVGAPLAGAQVEAFLDPPTPTDGLAPAFNARAVRTPVDSKATDAAGAAEFPALGLGRWTVVASAAGRATQARIVEGGHAARRRVTLRLGPARRLTGRVLDVDGRPVEDAVVLAVDVGNARTAADSDAASRRAPCRRGGRYELVDLADGPVRLSVMRDGDVPYVWGDASPASLSALDLVIPRRAELSGTAVDATSDGPIAGAIVRAWIGCHDVSATSDAAGAWRISYTPPAAASDDENLEVRVARKGFVLLATDSGAGGLRDRRDLRLKMAPAASVHGRVTGPAGPLAGVRVVAWADSTDAAERRVDATTDADGRYVVPAIAPGKASVFAQPIAIDIENARRDLVLAAGDDATIDFVLTKRDASPAVVRGRVESDDGSPIDGATVELVSAESSGPDDVTWTSSAADGTFEFPPLPSAARAQLVASAPTFRAKTASWTTIGALATATTIRLARGVRVTGRATSKDGRPLAGARVAVASVLDGASDVDPFAVLWTDGDPSTADRDGRFVAWFDGDGSKFAVAAAIAGLAPAASPPIARASCGATTNVDLVLDAGLPIRGVVLDGKDRAIGGAVVGIMAEAKHAWPIVAMAVADATGRFEIPHLPPRETTLALWNPGAAPTTRRVTPSADADVKFRVSR